MTRESLPHGVLPRDELETLVIVDNETDTLSRLVDGVPQVPEVPHLAMRTPPSRHDEGHDCKTVFGRLCCACHGYSVLFTGFRAALVAGLALVYPSCAGASDSAMTQCRDLGNGDVRIFFTASTGPRIATFLSRDRKLEIHPPDFHGLDLSSYWNNIDHLALQRGPARSGGILIVRLKPLTFVSRPRDFEEVGWIDDACWELLKQQYVENLDFRIE